MSLLIHTDKIQVAVHAAKLSNKLVYSTASLRRTASNTSESESNAARIRQIKACGA